MHVVSNEPEHSEAMTDPQSRVLAIEREIEELNEYAEQCRKGMQISRGAIVAGALLFIGSATGLVGGHSAVAVIGGFAAVIGGIVWLGANKSSGEEAKAGLRRAHAELARAIDELGLHPLN
jgi:predicted phage tail protein